MWPFPSDLASNPCMMRVPDKYNLPEPDVLPEVDTTSEEYALGFEAGTDGKPCEGETPEWRRGWADAQKL
ncbi:MAG TPA: hypothetical protein VK638_11730 [Edaphobacter sp.]|nr:hypothetical protein [Edaphobacter sp.]